MIQQPTNLMEISESSVLTASDKRETFVLARLNSAVNPIYRYRSADPEVLPRV